MGIEGLIIFLIVGAIAGWLAGVIVKGGGFGLVGDIVVGIVGAVIAGYLFPAMGFGLGGGGQPACAFSTRRRILPEADFGIASTKRKSRGCL